MMENAPAFNDEWRCLRRCADTGADRRDCGRKSAVHKNVMKKLLNPGWSCNISP